MNRRMVAAAMALVMIGSGLTACGSGSDAGPAPAASVSAGSPATATSTPTPTPSVSPTPNSTPNPSEDALFLEASKVHQKYLEEFVALEKAGGATTLPPAMTSLTGGDYEKAIANLFAEIHQKGIVASPDSTWRRVTISPAPAQTGYAIGITSCVDFRKMSYSQGSSGRTSQGSLRMDKLQLKRDGTSLVIADGTSKRVSSCDE